MKNFTRLKVDLALGPATVTLKKQDSSEKFQLGITTEAQAPTYTEEMQVVDKTTTTFGSTPVQKVIDGEIITFTLSVVLDLEAESKMSDILEITNTTKERNALVAGKELSGYVVNIHPQGAGGDTSKDINLVNATIQIQPNRVYNTTDDSYMLITFTALPAEREIDIVEMANATAINGGSLPDGKIYKYQFFPLTNGDIGGGSLEYTSNPTTTGLNSIELNFSKVYGAVGYRIFRSEDDGSTWGYFDKSISELSDATGIYEGEYSYIDNGSDVLINADPPLVASAKVYSTVVYGQSIDDISLSSAS